MNGFRYDTCVYHSLVSLCMCVRFFSMNCDGWFTVSQTVTTKFVLYAPMSPTNYSTTVPEVPMIWGGIPSILTAPPVGWRCLKSVGC